MPLVVETNERRDNSASPLEKGSKANFILVATVSGELEALSVLLASQSTLIGKEPTKS